MPVEVIMVNGKIHSFFSYNSNICLKKSRQLLCILFFFFTIFYYQRLLKILYSSFIFYLLTYIQTFFYLNCFPQFYFIFWGFFLCFFTPWQYPDKVGHKKSTIKISQQVFLLLCHCVSLTFPLSKIINFVPKFRLERGFHLKMDALGFKIKLKTSFRFRASLVLPHSMYDVSKCRRRASSSNVIMTA